MENMADSAWCEEGVRDKTEPSELIRYWMLAQVKAQTGSMGLEDSEEGVGKSEGVATWATLPNLVFLSPCLAAMAF